MHWEDYKTMAESIILRKLLCFYFVLLIFLNNASASESVPLLLWTNIRDSSCNQDHLLGPGETVTSVFTDDYMKCLGDLHPDKVVLFVSDQLGIEDFTIYGNRVSNENNPLLNIKKYLDHDESSLTVPSIQPWDITEDIISRVKPIVKEDVTQINLPAFDRSTYSARLEGLKHLDGQIKSTLGNTNGRFIAILTSEKAPDSYHKRVDREAVGRQLLAIAEPNDTRKVLHGDCVYMAFSSITFTAGHHNQTLQIPDSSAFKEEVCANTSVEAEANNATVVLSFVGGANDTWKEVNISLSFVQKHFPTSARYWWYLQEASVAYDSFVQPMNSPNRTYMNSIYAPLGWSFICSDSSLTYVDKTNTTPGVPHVVYKLEFENWQVQPFAVSNNTFGSAFDCIGWFTGPIWSGLLVALLLVYILSYGLSMITGLSTMDRFDDPKGKTITIPQDTS